MAACSITHCAAGVPKSDPKYAELLVMQEQGALHTTEINQLKKAGFGSYTGMDAQNDGITKYGIYLNRSTVGQAVFDSIDGKGYQAKPSIPAENQARLNKERKYGNFKQNDATQIQSLVSLSPYIAGTPQYAAYQRLVASTDGSNSIYTVSPVSRAQGLMTNDVPTQIGDIVHTDGGNLAIVTGRNADGTFRARLTTEQEDPRISGFANHTQLVSYATGLGTNLALAAASAASTPLTGESSKGSNTYSPRSDAVFTQKLGTGAIQEMPVSGLRPTQGVIMSNRQLNNLVKDIKANGVQVPITVTEYNGQTYILDGHHRAIAAQRAGVKNIPVVKVQLPFSSYKTPADLTYTHGGY